MKRPPGAIPPLTKEGLKTLIGKCVRVHAANGSPSNYWILKLARLDYWTADAAVFKVQRRFKNRVRVALCECVFDEEDPLVQSIRRERFHAKLKAQGTLS